MVKDRIVNLILNNNELPAEVFVIQRAVNCIRERLFLSRKKMAAYSDMYHVTVFLTNFKN